MTKKNKIIYFFVCLLFFVICDIFLSDLIISNIGLIAANPVLDLIFVKNEGAAFSLLEGSKLFLISFSIFAILVIIFYVLKRIKRITNLGLFFTAILSAGIFTNMTERILLGYVRDFIKLNFIDFPVFNISDIFINIGVFGIVIIIIMNNYFKRNEADNR